MSDFLDRFNDSYHHCLAKWSLDDLAKGVMGYAGCILVHEVPILVVAATTSDIAMSKVCCLMSYCMRKDPTLNETLLSLP